MCQSINNGNTWVCGRDWTIMLNICRACYGKNDLTCTKKKGHKGKHGKAKPFGPDWVNGKIEENERGFGRKS